MNRTTTFNGSNHFRWTALSLAVLLSACANLAPDYQRPAAPVHGLARGHLDPALADAVLLDVEALAAVEAYADVALLLKHRRHMVRAARINGEAVGQGEFGGIGHGRKSRKKTAGAALSRIRGGAPPSLRLSLFKR